MIGRPLAHTLAEAIRFALPFGGVPLASLAIGQAAGPFVGVSRVGGALLLIAIAAIVGTGVFNLAVLLGLTSWVVYGRVARAMALSLREREFVLSAVTQGASSVWNMRKHLLPNVLPQMLIVGSLVRI